MLLRRYLLSHFLKTHATFTLLFTAFILTVQLFNTFHLLFALPLWLSLSYITLLGIYTLLIGAAVALFVSSASLISALKERRTFHILYTFGISERRVLKILWSGVAAVAIGGVIASPFVNYQKIAYLVKYMKFQFGEKVLLTVPPKSFFTEEGLSFFFTSKGGNVFENVVVKVGKDLATAKRAVLHPDGTLRLEESSIFEKEGGYIAWMESKTYTLSLGGSYTYTLSRKKLVKNALFGVSLFAFPLLVYPLFFYLILKRSGGKFSAYMWGLLFTVFQFAVAIAAKSIG